MFAADHESNYDRIRKDLFVIALDSGAAQNAASLGGTARDGRVSIPVFRQECEVRSDDIYLNGRPLDTVGSILVLRYLMQSGDAELHHEWLPYRDLKDGRPFSTYIKAHIEDRIAAAFSGRAAALQQRLEAIGGSLYEGEVTGDLVMLVHPLPRVPVLCVFNDADDEFGAAFQFLFDGSAPEFLDLESLAAILQYVYINIAEEA
jgi:hypothetical protein